MYLAIKISVYGNPNVTKFYYKKSTFNYYFFNKKFDTEFRKSAFNDRISIFRKGVGYTRKEFDIT